MHLPNVLCIICAPRISDPEPRKIFGVSDEGCGGARKKKKKCGGGGGGITIEMWSS